METRFRHGHRSIYNVGYHLIWITKYRKPILKGKFKEIVKNALFSKANELNIVIEKYELMPDHVHLFVKCTPQHNIAIIVKHLKGYSSFMVRKTYPKYKVYKHFWGPSYYCESVGHISEETVKKYIEDQWSALNKKEFRVNSLGNSSRG